tara:strand:- start:3252 stop:3746 length:495 start_codon:yes stop_codon:yes gene_type:complete
MYKVTAYFKDYKVSEKFADMYDAIEFKDSADAHYPQSVTMEKVKDMREFVYTSWNSVMDSEVNPLRHIPDLHARHMVLQVLAWMWCIIFSFYVGSFVVFGVSAIAHVLLLGAIAITVGTFEVAKKKPTFFLKKGYHTSSRSRQGLWMNGEKIDLPNNDPGGEHE